MSNRVPCKYYKQGRCNKGNSCPFSHGNSYNYNNNNTNNTNDNSSRSSSPFWSLGSLDAKDEEIKQDLNEKKNFQSVGFSAYSLSGATMNLISGRDISPEELKWQYIQNPQLYEQHFQARTNDYQKVLNVLKKDTRKAARFLQVTTEHASKNNGNLSNVKNFIEFDLNLNDTGSFGGGAKQPFGNSSSAFPSAGSFGQQLFGANNNTGSAFGTSTFGAANNNSPSAFGSTGFGSTPTSAPAFGSSAFGSSTFGSTPASAPLLTPAFGSTAFGAKPPASASALTPAFGSTAFGATNSSTSLNPAFGSSAFGVPATKSAFGSTSAAPSSTAFGSFGNQTSSPFANLLSSASNTSPFGNLQNSNAKQQSVFGDAANSSSPFGSLLNQGKTLPTVANNTSAFNSLPNNNKPSTSAFGTTTTANNASSAFGNSSFGAPLTNPFSTTSTSGNAPSSSSSSFGALGNNDSQTKSPFGNISMGSATPFGNSNTQQPQLQGIKSSEPLKVPDTKVNHTEDSSLTAEKEVQIYSIIDVLSDGVKRLFQAEKFEMGKVPEIAPPAELC